MTKRSLDMTDTPFIKYVNNSSTKLKDAPVDLKT
eukprot:CAMPEP_0197738264 /NCGR_PEP_ID=MMETSP1435-20131217/13695_1 /TAXON_ID=426625 /ORGANISM="Chaetoceros brevis, Strain CCMP164" /LENGTH=33 /DNA_ID= /DNA_START= /DNA_END= /DNA_ORIENTATION=